MPHVFYNLSFLGRVLRVRDSYMMRAELILKSTLTSAAICIILLCALLTNQGDPSGEKHQVIYSAIACVQSLLLIVVLQICSLWIPYAAAARMRRPVRRNAPQSTVSSVRTQMTFREFEAAVNNPEFLSEIREQLAKDFCVENAVFLDSFDRFAAAATATAAVHMPGQALGPESDISLTATAARASSLRTFYNVSLTNGVSASRDAERSNCAVATQLYEKFIEVGAPYELNINCETRRQLTQ